MADKTIAIAVQIEGDAQLRQLQANFDQVRRARIELNKAEKAGTITAKEANAQRAQLNVQLKANRNALTDHQNALLKNNNALKKNSGFVAGVKKGMGQWATSMIGVTAAIAGITRIIGDAAARIKSFDTSIKNLSAITGATGEDLDFLKDKAIQLGKTTTLTASQVADAFKLIASSKPELLENGEALASVTEQAIVLAEAAKIDVTTAADALTLSLNQFGAGADEAAKFVDVLAAGSKKGAGDIQFLNDAFAKTGGAADAAGLSFVDTAAAIETLAPVMETGQEAGTKFRNILANLQKEGIGFKDGQFDINFALDETNKMLNSIEDPAERAAARIELFGKQNDAAGIQLLNNTEVLAEFQVELDKTGTALEQQAINNSTVEASFKKLDSAYEGLLLTIEDGDGQIANTIQGWAEMTANIINLITSLESAEGRMEAFTQIGADYAVQVGLMNREEAEFNKNLANNAANIEVLQERLEKNQITQEQYAKAIQLLGKGWKQASKEIQEGADAIAGANDAASGEGGEGGLTQEEQDALKKKAEARAKKLRELQAEADRQARQEDFLEEDDDLDSLLNMEIEKNEALLAVDKEYLDAKRAQEQEALDEQIAAEEKAAKDRETIEQLKRDSINATADITAGFFELGASLAKEGSKEQKILASAAALIQTYQAAQAAYLSQLSIPTPTAPVRAAAAASLAVASGLANVAKINGVQFEDGGILQGASHAEGGIPFSIGGQLGFEAEGGEAIINKRSTEMFAPLLSAINQAGGGVAFERGGRLTKFQGGGALPTNVGVTAAQQGMASGALDLDEFSSAIVDGINDKEVINVSTNTTDSASEVLNIQSEASF